MFVDEMTRLSGWITATPASQLVQSMGGYVPATQSVHILAIATVIASASMLNLRLVGLMNRSLPVVSVGERFRRPLWLGVSVLVLSGLALLLAEPERSLVSEVFQLKMVLLAIAVAATLWLQRVVARQAASWDATGHVPGFTRAAALVSLLLWITIIFSGRWIAYAQY
jgi:hypothetical protein